MIYLVDSYPISNYLGQVSVYNGASNTLAGQSFTNALKNELTHVDFYLSKIGSPTGVLRAKLFAHSGVYGTSSVPTGSALATSDHVDVGTLTADKELISFSFPPGTTLAENTKYIILCDSSGVAGNSTNAPRLSLDSGTTTHAGNRSYSMLGVTWTISTTTDLIFYVYGWINDPHVYDPVNPYAANPAVKKSKPYSKSAPYSKAKPYTRN